MRYFLSARDQKTLRHLCESGKLLQDLEHGASVTIFRVLRYPWDCYDYGEVNHAINRIQGALRLGRVRAEVKA
jgi:hypothetical protein